MAATGRLARIDHARSLDDRRWRRRHALLATVLALHLPVLAAVGAVTGASATSMAVALGVVAALLVVGMAGRGRQVRTLGVTLGLLSCSAALVHLTGGLIEAHFHYFLAIGLVAAYHDWRPYALSVAFVVSTHGLVGVLWPASMYNHPDALRRPWLWAVVHGGFILGVSVLLLLAWRTMEREQRQARLYYEQLFEGERAVVKRLREAEEAKDRLLAVTSHELRTPLTAIAGLARTLAVHHDSLESSRVAECVGGIEEHTARLTRVVDNLVAASGGDPGGEPAGGGSVELAAVVAATVRELDDGTVPFEAAVPRGVLVGLDEVAARQVIGNLLDNARKFAPAGTTVTVTARVVGADVELAVTNVLRPGDEAAVRTLGDRLFDRFVQADSSDTRAAEGLGLGLYVVRTVAGSHGGRVGLRAQAGGLTVFLTLPATLAVSLLEEESPAPVRT